MKPTRATYKDLAVYHSRDFLDFVLDAKNSTQKFTGKAGDNVEFGLEDVCLRDRSLY